MENYGDYGLEAELAVLDYLNANTGFTIGHNEPVGQPFPGGRMTQSMVKMAAQRGHHGDILLYYGENQMRMNVVRGTWVSHQAVDRFRGQFYCLFPHGDILDPSQGRVILTSTLKNFWSTCKKKGKWTEYINDKPGFRYNKLKAFITLEDLQIQLSKLMIMNVPYSTREFWSTLRYPFIKDYIKLAQEAKA